MELNNEKTHLNEPKPVGKAWKSLLHTIVNTARNYSKINAPYPPKVKKITSAAKSKFKKK